MEKHGDEVEVTEREAKAGSRPQGMRYVLIGSLLLAVIVMTIVWVLPALGM